MKNIKTFLLIPLVVFSLLLCGCSARLKGTYDLHIPEEYSQVYGQYQSYSVTLYFDGLKKGNISVQTDGNTETKDFEYEKKKETLTLTYTDGTTETFTVTVEKEYIVLDGNDYVLTYVKR